MALGLSPPSCANWKQEQKKRIHFPNYSELGLPGNSCTCSTKATPPQRRKETGDGGPVRKTDRQRSDLDGGDCWRTPAGYCGIRSIQLNVKMWGRGAQEMECATNYSLTLSSDIFWGNGASRGLRLQVRSAARTVRGQPAALKWFVKLQAARLQCHIYLYCEWCNTDCFRASR